MLVIPAIDLADGRSRVVSWPGAATGEGTPTDRPERIAERFVAAGAPLLHVVDLDGARTGTPGNLDAIARIAALVAVPIQLAGGMEGADNIRLAFAAGATRVVVSMGVADRPDVLDACLAVAGDWLAVGLDPRPDRIVEYPWRRPHPPSLDELVDELTGRGVRRLVLSHGGAAPDAGLLARLVRPGGPEILVAGGIADIAGIRGLREAGVHGVILGEALLSGAIDYPAALEAAA